MKNREQFPQKDYLATKRRSISFQITIIIFIYIIFSLLLKFNTLGAIFNAPKGIWGFFTIFWPTVESLSNFPKIGNQLWKTVIMAVSATFMATITAFILALLGCKALDNPKSGRLLIRWFALIIRNIPIVAWAMILLLTFKQSEFTGFLALYITTLGLLIRAFIEIIDTAALAPLEAMTVLGATALQKIRHCIIPIIHPQIISWTLYMIETNIRNATLVGILTSTGIGFLFEVYFKSMRYDSAGLVVWCIIIAVISLEKSTNYLRKELLTDAQN
ncbi:MAG: PhnE/PtxC family ABC transporter permease [Culicoidibacterales bacterium]